MAQPQEPGGGDDTPDRDTLIRLANSCERAAARVANAGSRLRDLDEQDYRTIARVLRGLADS